MCTTLLLEKSRQRTQNACQISPENGDSLTRNIHAVTRRDEKTPEVYFAFLLGAKIVSSERIFNNFCEDKKKKSLMRKNKIYKKRSMAEHPK